MTTCITGVPTQVDEVPELEICEHISWDEEPEPKMDVYNKETAQNVDTEVSVVVKTVDEETEEYRIYPSIQIHQNARYEPTFQGKWYECGAMILNFEDTLGYTMTKLEYVEKILGIIMDHQYILKAFLKRYG